MQLDPMLLIARKPFSLKMSRQNKAAVLFTGGADSALTASVVLEKHNTVILLTFKTKYDLFVGRACLVADRLKRKSKHTQIRHEIIENTILFHSACMHILPKCFGLSFALFAERGAMYIRTVEYCLNNSIKDVYDGSTYSQAAIATPQKTEVLNIVRYFFASHGLALHSPIYNNTVFSEQKLLDEGLINRCELYQETRLYFNRRPGVLQNIALGLKNKINNKLHPVFFIETMMQLFGTILQIQKRSNNKWQNIVLHAEKSMQEVLCFGKAYIAKNCAQR